MSLLRRTRTEVAGAWRSLRYDLGRAPAAEAEAPPDGPDVTSTGMSTFGAIPVATGVAAGVAAENAPAPHRRPKRAVAVIAFGTLTVVGAAGAYLAVVNGLGSLLTETPAAADTFPARPVATSDARIGAGPATARPRTASPASPARVPAATTTEMPGVPVRNVPPAAAPAPATAVAGPVGTKSPARPAKPAKTECHCQQPPVPTPNVPTSSPSATPSPSASASASPSPSESASPSGSAEPSPSWQGRRHRRHNH
jgi:hypothetical protein